MAELKPCPFCGGEARLKHGYPNRQCKSLRQSLVQCNVCKCRTVTYKQFPYQAWSDVDRIAIEAWNRRHTPSEIDFDYGAEDV